MEDKMENARVRALEEERNYDGESWVVLDPTNPLYKKVQFALVGTEENKFEIDFIAEALDADLGSYADPPRYIIHLWAGKNGNGKWNEYFVDAVSIINKLKSKETVNNLYVKNENDYEQIDVGKMFSSAWLIKWTNDCADDLSDLYIGVRE